MSLLFEQVGWLVHTSLGRMCSCAARQAYGTGQAWPWPCMRRLLEAPKLLQLCQLLGLWVVLSRCYMSLESHKHGLVIPTAFGLVRWQVHWMVAHMCVRSVCRLVGWLIGWLMGWPAGRLAGWFIDRLQIACKAGAPMGRWLRHKPYAQSGQEGGFVHWLVNRTADTSYSKRLVVSGGD